MLKLVQSIRAVSLSSIQHRQRILDVRLKRSEPQVCMHAWHRATSVTTCPESSTATADAIVQQVSSDSQGTWLHDAVQASCIATTCALVSASRYLTPFTRRLRPRATLPAHCQALCPLCSKACTACHLNCENWMGMTSGFVSKASPDNIRACEQPCG